jgi:hypothetical protein
LCLATPDRERSGDSLDRVSCKDGSVKRLEAERIPVAGDFISPGGQDLASVAAVVLKPKRRGIAAMVHAVEDADSVSGGLQEGL